MQEKVKEPQARRFWTLSVASLFGIAVFFRIWKLGKKSFWIDEIISALWREKGWEELWSHRLFPLNELVLSLSGGGEFFLRLPSFFAALLSLFIFLKLSSLFLKKEGKIFSLSLFSFSPFLISWAQDARFYAFFLLFSLLSFLFFFKGLKEKKIFLIPSFLFASLSVYGTPWGLLILGGETLFLLFKRETIKKLFLPLTLGVASLSPLFPRFLTLWSEGKVPSPFPPPHFDFAFFLHLFKTLSGSFPLFIFLGVLSLGGLVYFWRKNRSFLFFSFLLFLSPFFFFSFFRFSHFFAPRYVIYFLPLWFILGGGGVEWFLGTFPRLKFILSPLVGGLILLSLFPLLRYYGLEKQNWRGAAEFLRGELKEGDLLVGGPIGYLALDYHCILYYLSLPQGVTFAGKRVYQGKEIMNILWRRYRRVWLVTGWWYDLPFSWQEWIKKRFVQIKHFQALEPWGEIFIFKTKEKW